jgi:hypothetical protein
MIGLDTNLLVTAYAQGHPNHAVASRVIRDLAESPAAWAIPWPCLHEFISITTNPRIFTLAASPSKALNQVAAWCESPSLRILSESSHHLATLTGLLEGGATTGPRIHDAKIAAICLDHGVTRFLTADRDFRAFRSLRVSNPFSKA